jgi:hypothetical protein
MAGVFFCAILTSFFGVSEFEEAESARRGVPKQAMVRQIRAGESQPKTDSFSFQ